MEKKLKRLKRAQKPRAKIKRLLMPRLSVHRTSKHIYAQIIDSVADKVIASASTRNKDVKLDSTSNVAAAKEIGKLIAERGKAEGIEKVAFDRSGFKFHGRVRALAESAREHGLKF